MKGYEFLNSSPHGLTVKLYWQAVQQPDFNYSAFVHLVDDNDQIIAQMDRAPGEGQGYPPSLWVPLDIVVEEYMLEIPQRIARQPYRIRTGLYNWQTGQTLPVTQNGNFNGDYVILDQTWQPAGATK